MMTETLQQARGVMLTAQAEQLFRDHQEAVYRRTDRLFAWLLGFQWLAAVGVALWVSPRTWAGPYSQTHLHVWAALGIGGPVVSLPILLAVFRPGRASTRHVVGVAQMLLGALLIHLTGGRLETHFHVFGSLAFLAFYRDWRVLVSASAVAAADHFLRGLLWPQSVYGVVSVEGWRWLEHAGWVVFEDAFLILSCLQGVHEMRAIAVRQLQLERDQVAKTVRQVQAAAECLATASQQFTAAASQLSAGTQQQAASLEETAASLEEITSTIKQNADNARQANRLATGSREVAERGGQVVREAVAAMGEINQASRRITDVITAVDEIAFQTNLLALNAAVEAARAGGHGRGFAVVAAEVRALSQRSAAAAKEIKGLVQDSVRKVEAGNKLVGQSGHNLEEIIASVRRVAELMTETAASSQEQATGISQVNRALAQMDGVVQQNVAQTEELTSTAHALAQQAQDLRGLVGQFQLGDGAAALAPAAPSQAAALRKRWPGEAQHRAAARGQPSDEEKLVTSPPR
jgi:uncharacterized protein YoxC